ncbi:MAG TPA: hypothetical protein VFN99_06905 [Gaiella sp.]|nr:hypothetical protein [Gaiella sp.]
MREDSQAMQREAPRARDRLASAWVVAPVVIAVVFLTVVVIGWLV